METIIIYINFASLS